jgi:uncharacterized protein YndB with AHSA1/START domain
MNRGLVAEAAIAIDAAVEHVWKALVDPGAVKQYFFGTDVVTDWREGSPIAWRGVWEGRAYEDKGVILQLSPGRRIQYTHFSPLSGLPDVPDNYHTVTIDLSSDGLRTHVSLTQDNNASEEERDHSRKNWETVLEGLKHYVEG